MSTQADTVKRSRRRKVVAILGDGRMAAECIRIAATRRQIRLAVVIHHEDEQAFSQQVRKICTKSAISNLCVSNVNERRSLNALQALRPDAVFNVNSWDIIRRRLLAIPRHFVVNFHNGPLPQYRGVNCPSWAIINQEKRYGVAWHLVSREIDAGHIVAAQRVAVAHDETAISLIFKCIDTGLNLFPRLLDEYVANRLTPRPQRGEARYYAASDTPNEGLIDFGYSFERLSALVRGLNFRPFENPMTYPKVMIGGRAMLVTGITRAASRGNEGSWTCGQVKAIDEQGVVVCACDSCVRLSGLMNQDLEFVSAREMSDTFGLSVGDVLSCD